MQVLVIGSNAQHGFTLMAPLCHCLGGVESLLNECWKVRVGCFNGLGNDNPFPALGAHGGKIIWAHGTAC